MAGGGDRRGGRGGGSEDDRLHNFLGALWPRYFGKGELFFYPAPGQTRPTQRPRRPLARLSDSDQVEEAQAREYAELLERTATRRETVLAFAHLLRFSAEKDSDLLPVANDYSGIGPGIVIQVDKMLRALQESSLNAAQGASVRRAIASLGDEPAETLGCLGLSLCLAAKYVLEMSETAALEKIYWPRIVPPKDFGSTPIGNLRGAFVGRFICATGTVVRASKISLLALGASFKCERCGHICDELVPFRDGKYEVPLRCVSPDGCKSRTFDIVRDSAETVDSQTLVVQEMQGDDWEPGRMPSTVNVELTEDLVDCCIPGDHITVYGIARSDNAETARGKSSKIAKSSGEHLLYVQASNVMNLTRAAAARDNQSSPGQGLAEAMSPFTENDYAMIREISSSPCPFYCLVASLCPGIFGQELVKAGLLLALLGGTKKQAEVAVRNDIHTLVVGDPGLGKSQLLKAVAAVAPRSVYVGSNTTKSGLTATVTKDGLEAGALVLADQGVCCIDEFDKLNCDHRALLEAMEQQQVSIAKSGIVASLSARCSVIAAANPIGGHYDRSATVSRNIRMAPALLSRFDLIFIILDRPDARHDQMLSNHIMNSYQQNDLGPFATAAVLSRRVGVGVDEPGPDDLEEDMRSLSQRLRAGVKECPAAKLLKYEDLRKYISYARTYCHPRLSNSAAKVLQELYMRMRSEASSDTTPITTRQLESLIRLSQAWARAELREEVTAVDAKAVVDLMQESMLDASCDEFGAIDFGMGRPSGSARRRNGKRAQRDNYLKALKRDLDRKGSNIFTEQELKEIIFQLRARSGSGFDLDWNWLLHNLSEECYILRNGPRLFSVQRNMLP